MAVQADPNLLSRFNAGFSGCPMDQVNRRKGLGISWIHTVELYSFPMFLDLWHHSVLTVEAEKNPKTCSFPFFLSLINRLEPSIPRPVAELRTHWSGASCKGLGGAEKVKGWMRVGWSWWSWWSWWSLVWYWCILFLYFMYMRGIFISCNHVGSSAYLGLRILVASCNTMSQGCTKMIQNAQHILLGVALARNSTSCWMTWSKVSDVGECESSHFTKIVFSSIDMNVGVELLNLSH